MKPKQNLIKLMLMLKDSKENVILKLKRELRRLKFENQILKQKIGVVAPVNKNPSATSLPRLGRNGKKFIKAITKMKHNTMSYESIT